MASIFVDILPVRFKTGRMTPADEPSIDALRTSLGGEPTTQLKADYLRLPPAKRLMAAARIAVLQQFATTPASRAEQAAAAKDLGIGLKRLQSLMRGWRTPNINDVVPHAAGQSRAPRSSPNLEVARRICAKAAAKNRGIAEPTVMRRITRVCERLGLRPPARMTVRRLLERAKRDLPTIDFAAIEAAETTDPAPALPGEILLITTETFRVRLLAGNTPPRRASAILLIDAVSGVVLAANVAGNIPRLLNAAADAIDGGMVADSPSWSPPAKLLLGPPMVDDDWRARLAQNAAASGMDVEIATRRRTRRWTASILWQGQRHVQLATDGGKAEPPADWPLYGIEELEEELAAAIDDHATACMRRLDNAPHTGEPNHGDVAAAAIRQLVA